MLNLILAMVVFVGGHFLLSSSAVRPRLVEKLGQGPYLAAYSLLAGATLLWVVLGWRAAPLIWLWGQPVWARHLLPVLMPLSLVLIAGAYLTRNPMAVGQAGSMRDSNLGMLAVTRHPGMWGIAIWAVGHLLANGDAASLVGFGGLGVLALGGAAHIDARRRAADPEGFSRFAAVTSFLPFAAILAGRASFDARGIGWAPVVAGLLAYAVLLALHPWLFGVSPLPV